MVKVSVKVRSGTSRFAVSIRAASPERAARLGLRLHSVDGLRAMPRRASTATFEGNRPSRLAA